MLARMLSPKEFGVIGLFSFLFVLSDTLINSGFSQALIRNPDNTAEDYSTAFVFNIVTGALIVAIICMLAPYIAIFLEIPESTNIIRVMSLGQLVLAFTLVQRSIVSIEMNFKSLSVYAIISSVVSGIIALTMAWLGYGIWSLVAKALLRDGISSFLIWWNAKWKPVLLFSLRSFKSLYGYGFRLLLSGIFGAIANNIVTVVIGKHYSISDVGHYTRADLFKNLPSQNIESIITGVGYPALAKIQNDREKFTEGVRLLLVNTAFIIFPLMFMLAGIAKPLINLLLGEQWAYSAILLQIMCPIGVIYPLWTINLNVLGIVGRSDLYLRVQFVYQVLLIMCSFLAILFNIEILIVLIGILNIVSYLLYSKISSRFTGYDTVSQLKDIFPLLVTNVFMLASVWLIGHLASAYHDVTSILLQVLTGIVAFILANHLLKIQPYFFFKNVVEKQLFSTKN
jgi:teichuronic acid exporter